jgi:hypothetical protein
MGLLMSSFGLIKTNNSKLKTYTGELYASYMAWIGIADSC